MGCTQGTTSLAERPEPLGRRTESLYYLSLIVGKKAGQRTQTRVISTKSVFLYFRPEAAHRRATSLVYGRQPKFPIDSFPLILSALCCSTEVHLQGPSNRPRSTSSSRAAVPSLCNLDPLFNFLFLPFSSVPSTEESPFRASQLGPILNPILPFRHPPDVS